MNLKKTGAALFVILLMVVAAPKSASAATIVLTQVAGNEYQSSVQNPCIFTNPPCLAQNPAAFPSTPVPNQGNVTSYDLLSPVYTLTQLTPYLNGGSVFLGYDVNQAESAQTLSLFTMAINGIVTDTYSFGGTGNIPVNNNGTGYADYTLTGFSSLVGKPGSTTIQFRYQFKDGNDGSENIFLVAGPNTPTNPVPEPASMLLLGTGLLVAARARRRKTN